MKELRILACAFTCCPPSSSRFRGGEDILGWNLLKQIARFHEVWVLTRAEDRLSIEQALAEDPEPNIHVCYIGLPSWLIPLLRFQGSHQFYYYLWQVQAYFTARLLHKEIKFDIFHHITYANDWMASYIGALLPVSYVRGPGGGAHRTPKGFEKEYTLGGRLWEKFRGAGQWILRHDPFFVRGQSRASAILLCNRESVSHASGKWQNKVHLYPVSGVSTDDFKHKVVPDDEDGRFRVLSAGSLLKVKGYGLAIKAFSEFAARHPQCDFTIVGSGPENARLVSLIHDLGLEGKVHLAGAMPRAILLSEMASSDVFLFPSLRDGGGTVAVEAMAVGKPVVCLDIGGPGTNVGPDCGIKVPATNVQQAVGELAEALERLYSDRDLRLKMGQAAQKRAIACYHWDRLGDRLSEIYRTALGHTTQAQDD